MQGKEHLGPKTGLERGVVVFFSFSLFFYFFFGGGGGGFSFSFFFLKGDRKLHWDVFHRKDEDMIVRESRHNRNQTYMVSVCCKTNLKLYLSSTPDNRAMHISTVMIHRTGCSIENTEHGGLRPRACSLCFFAFRTLLRAVQDGNIPPKSNHPTTHWPRMKFLQQLHCSTWVRKGDGAFCGMWDDFICRSGVVFPVTRANPTADPRYPFPWCLEHQRVRVMR